METRQKSARDLVDSIGGKRNTMVVAAAALALISLLLPFIGFTTNLGMGMDSSSSVNGFTASGWVAWLVVLTFAGVVASRFVDPLRPYQNLLAAAVMALSVLCIIWGMLFNPLASESKQFSAMFGDDMSLATFYPHIGSVLLLGSCVLLFLARRGEAKV